MALKEELQKQGDFLFTYRSSLPFILLVFGILIKIYQVLYEADSIVSEILESSAIYVGLFGLFIRVITVGYTPAFTSGRASIEGQVAESLNTTGLYSLIRNPLYLGNYFMWLAIAMLTGNIWFVIIFSLVFWIYYERIVYAEETFLRDKFGDVYLEWAKKTAVFLPKHFKYKKPELSFSWKKAMKKEKNGLFALFLLFVVFKTLGAYVEDQTYIIEETWLYVCTIATGFSYIVLKILKKYTNVLNEEGR